MENSTLILRKNIGVQMSFHEKMVKTIQVMLVFLRDKDIYMILANLLKIKQLTLHNLILGEISLIEFLMTK